MCARVSAALSVPRTYAELLQRVRGAMLAAQAEIEWAWAQTYHEAGRLIHSHLLLNQGRADYGGQVMRGLARDTQASERKPYECAQFYRCFPILRKSAKLGWSHYVVLCQVGNERERAALMAQAEKRGWNSTELKSQSIRRMGATVSTDTLRLAVPFVSPPTSSAAFSARTLRPRVAKGPNGDSAGAAEVFLNNHLLEQGHAARKDAWELGDWE